MYTLGHTFVPTPVHAGGLRYHGDAPSLSGLVKAGHMEARAFTQNEVFTAAQLFAQTQGIIPGPEPAHAVKAVIDEAEAARESGEERVILFNLSGHGFFDMTAYDDFLNGRLPEVEYEESRLQEGLKSVPMEIPAG
jgi:tryptophan synthase beta chain